MSEDKLTVSKALWEHLKTRRKYNKLMVKYEAEKQEKEDKIYENNQLKRQLRLQENIWESRVIELENKLSRKVGKNARNTKSKSVKVSRKEQNDNK